MTTFTRKCLLACFTFIALSEQSSAQISFQPFQSGSILAQNLTGPNVTISNPLLFCPTTENGLFTYAGSSTLDMTNGVILATGTVQSIANAAAYMIDAGQMMQPGDADLANDLGTTTYDACILEVDVIPNLDSIYVNYTFASEEYPENACSDYNDGFGIYITGPGFPTATNIALVPGTDIPTSINSVNSAPTGTTYPLSTCNNVGPGSPFNQYYVNNSGGVEIAFDGLTRLMRAAVDITPGQSYHLKFVVANAEDGILQSGLFLQAGSLGSSQAPLSITQLKNEAKAVIFPNPFNSALSIQLPQELMNKNVAATIVNTIGQTVYEHECKGVDMNRSLQKATKLLNAGIYSLTLRSEHHYQVLKFHKQDP